MNSPATLRNGGSGAQCGDCNKDTRSWPRSTHVRWLYNLKRAANAAAVFDGFFFGVPPTRAVSPIAEGLPGLVVSWLLALGDLVLSQRGTSEHTVKQASLSPCCIVRGGGLSSKVFSDRFPERIVLEVKPG